MIHEDFIAFVAYNTVSDLRSVVLNTLKDLQDFCEFASFAVAVVWLSQLGPDTLQELNSDWASEGLSNPRMRRVHVYHRKCRGPIPTRSRKLLDICLESMQTLD